MLAKLITLQKQLQNYVLEDQLGIETQIVSVNDQEDFVATRLAIYADGYRLRFLEVLENDYPVLSNICGEDIFEEMVDHYIDQYPSQHFSLNYFGQYFAQFLAQHSDYQQQKYWSELAQFEWLLGETRIAADAVVKTQADLAAIGPEQWSKLQVVFHPSIRSMTGYWNIADIWQAYSKQLPLPIFSQYSELQRWVCWRYQNQTHYIQYNAADALAFEQLQQGECFATVCEVLCEYLPLEQVPTFIAQFLINCFNQGMISRINTSI